MDVYNTLEVSKWMSVVANKYNKSIITVIEEFNKALETYKDIELAKVKTVNELCQRRQEAVG